MKRVLFFCSEYWGHISLCLGLANVLKDKGILSIFAFVFHPPKYIVDIIKNNGFECIFETNVKQYLYSSSYEARLDFEDEARKRLIRLSKAAVVVSDASDYSVFPSLELNVPIFRIKRTNIEERVNDSISRFYRKKYFGSCELTWREMLKESKIIAPHAKSFLEIDRSVLYFRPYWAHKNSMDSELMNDFDIVCVLTTAAQYKSVNEKLLDALEHMNLKVLCCDPFEKQVKSNGRIITTPWADLDSVIKYSKMIISTGGHGIVTRAIIESIPQIVLDINVDFVNIYAERIVDLGLGLYSESTTSSIRNSIEYVWNNHDSFLEKTREMAKEFEGLDSIAAII